MAPVFVMLVKYMIWLQAPRIHYELYYVVVKENYMHEVFVPLFMLTTNNLKGYVF